MVSTNVRECSTASLRSLTKIGFETVSLLVWKKTVPSKWCVWSLSSVFGGSHLLFDDDDNVMVIFIIIIITITSLIISICCI